MVLPNLNEGFNKAEIDIFTVRKLFADLRTDEALELIVVKKLVVVGKPENEWQNIEFTIRFALEIYKSQNTVSALL